MTKSLVATSLRLRRLAFAAIVVASLLGRVPAQTPAPTTAAGTPAGTSPGGTGTNSTSAPTASSPSIPSIGFSGPFWQSSSPLGNASGTWPYALSDPVFELSELRRRWTMDHAPAISFGVYFPPTPAALAQPLDQAKLRVNTPGFPPELFDYLGEPFYMAYAPLHQRKVLYRSRERRVEVYRTTRNQLIAELRGFLEALARTPPAGHTNALTQFAAQQAGPLAALEGEAEAIRHDLTTTNLLHATADGSALRSWRDATRGDSALVSEYMGLLLAADFQDGLSADQRRLLHELALELRFRVQAVASNDADEYVFFWPATARIRLPANLPAGLAAQVRSFREAKEALGRELRELVARDDQFFFVSRRTEQFQQLAEQQAPRFAELEEQAERIRIGLAGLPYPDEPPRSELPPELTQRVGALVINKAALRRDVAARLKELQRQFRNDAVELVRRGDGVALVVQAKAARSEEQPQRVEILAALASFNRAIDARYRSLAQETEALRREIQRHAEARPRDGRTVEQWAAAFNTSYAAQQTWNRYRDYRRAVLEPGLSPAQRRLLFRAAVIDLTKAANQPSA